MIHKSTPAEKSLGPLASLSCLEPSSPFRLILAIVARAGLPYNSFHLNQLMLAQTPWSQPLRHPPLLPWILKIVPFPVFIIITGASVIGELERV